MKHVMLSLSIAFLVASLVFSNYDLFVLRLSTIECPASGHPECTSSILVVIGMFAFTFILVMFISDVILRSVGSDLRRLEGKKDEDEEYIK
jgi:hypothetical protein